MKLSDTSEYYTEEEVFDVLDTAGGVDIMWMFKEYIDGLDDAVMYKKEYVDTFANR